MMKELREGREMTSTEAMAKLKENFENDVYKVEREMLNIVDKDLAISEILKKYIYFDKKDNLIKMRTIEKRWENFDFEIIKEWLENDNQR